MKLDMVCVIECERVCVRSGVFFNCYLSVNQLING